MRLSHTTAALLILAAAALILSGCKMIPGSTSKRVGDELVIVLPEENGEPTADDEAGSAESTPEAGSEADTETQRLRQEVARLRADLAAEGDAATRRPAAAGPAKSGPGLAIAFAGPRTPEAVDAQRAFSQVIGDYPLTLVDAARTEGALAANGCTIDRPTPCLGDLAAGTGARLLAGIEGLERSGDTVDLRVALFDTELGIAWPAFTMVLPRGENGIPESALYALADAVLLNAQSHLAFAPAVHRAVDSTDGTVVLNRGRKADLAVGDLLGVHPSGRLVRTAGGAPAAWIPARAVGTLRVTGFAPNGSALAEVVEGRAPDRDDYLIPRGG